MTSDLTTHIGRFQLAHVLGLVLGVLSVVVILWTDVQDGKGGVTAGGADRMTGDGFSLLSAALAGSAQVTSSDCRELQI